VGRQAKAQGSVYIQFIGGPRHDHDYGSDGAIDSAKHRLDAFDIIGFLEHLDHFKQRMLEDFGIRLNIPHKRKSPARKHDPHRQMMTEYKQSHGYRKRVADICVPDIKLYEHALEKFVRQIS
jgi:hypothetical protein